MNSGALSQVEKEHLADKFAEYRSPQTPLMPLKLHHKRILFHVNNASLVVHNFARDSLSSRISGTPESGSSALLVKWITGPCFPQFVGPFSNYSIFLSVEYYHMY